MPRHAEVLDLVWQDDDENNTYLIGCTSLGQVAVWKMDDTIAESEQEDDSMNTKPIVTLDVSSKALRSIQIATTVDNNGLLLFLAGDEGLLTMKWEDLFAKNAPTKTVMDGSFQQVQVYQNHVYILTNNSTVLKVDSKTFQIVARYPPPPPNDDDDNDVSATTFKVVKGISSKNGGPLLLVGTTNSQVWIWDVTKNKALEPLHLLNHRHNKNHKNNKANTSGASCTVTSICTNNENDLWWTIAGTLHNSVPQQAEGGVGGGFVSTWHGPTRSILSRCDTQESIHRLDLSHNGTLYSAANQGVVSVWESPHQLTETHRRRIWVSPPSGKALATSKHSKNNNKRVAMAGVGPKVDILEDHCRLFTVEL
jgi:hypothetical protein